MRRCSSWQRCVESRDRIPPLLTSQHGHRPAAFSRAVSPTNEDHWPVLHLGYTEHASVLFLLPPHCSSYYLQEFLIGCSRAQTVSQRYLGVSEQTHLQVAISCDAQTVAGATEMIRHGGDETQLALKSWYSESLRPCAHTYTHQSKNHTMTIQAEDLILIYLLLYCKYTSVHV